MEKTNTIMSYIGGLGIFAYLGLSIELIVLYLLLMLADTLLRYIGAIIHSKLNLEKAKDGLLKKFSLIIMIFSAALFLKSFNIVVEFQFDNNTILGLFILTLIVYEIHSIFNKIYYIRTGQLITENDALSQFIKKIFNLIGKGIDFIQKKLLDKFR